MRSTKAQSWVVYSMPVRDNVIPMRCVCEQSEWETIERSKPGHYVLIQSGITNEGEAERLARGSSGEARPRTAKRVAPTWANQTTPATVSDAPAES